jgi:UDP-3-O-[3-hydroxymyristoyl] glucosamine N-acyltransferase
MKLSDLARKTHATLERGSPDMEISDVASLDAAAGGNVTFLANPKFASQVATTGAGAIYLGTGVAIERDDIAILRVDDAYLARARAMQIFHPVESARPFIHPAAVIDPTAQISESAEIHAGAVIGAGCRVESGVRIMANATLYDDVTVGPNTTIHSGVSLREKTKIGARCIIHNNTTIGADGFGYAKDEEKRWIKVPQTGWVVLEDDVEIGANTAIDRGSTGESRIGRGTKIDNLVQIGHSCTIEEDALICSQTGLAGSSHIGKRVILAGQVGIAGHLKVGDDAVLTAKSATSHDVEPGKIISGIPAFDNRDWLRSTAAYRKLGEMAQRLRALEKRVFSDDK